MANFEFTQEQDSVFLQLVNSMRAFGAISIVIGCLVTYSGVALILDGSSSLVTIARAGQGIAAFLVGFIWWSSASRFRAIADTQGNDIDHLISGIKTLSSGFLLIMLFAFIRVFLQGTTAVNNIMSVVTPQTGL